MRRIPMILIAVIPVIALSLPAQADPMTATPATIGGAVITTSPPPADAPPGVSPDVYFDAASQTYYLLTTANPAVQYVSRDGTTWTATNVALPPGFDWSIVREGPASYRLYYAEVVMGTPGQGPPPPCTPGSKRLRYATSTDLQSWSVQPEILLNDVGCGVPHVMKAKDGRYFLYFNKRDPVHGIYVGTSSDGLSWSIGSALVGNDAELVDPAPIEMPDGTFLMVASTLGKSGYQELQLLSSADALTWTKRPTDLYSPAGASVLDPSVELIDGRLRVWFGYALGGSHDVSRIAHGSIILGTAKIAKGKKCTLKGAISGTLTCKAVKGRLIWS
jgi:hypothetical protein